MPLYYTVLNLIHAKSLRKATLLAIILNKDMSKTPHTIYFFNKEEKALLPICISDREYEEINNAQNKRSVENLSTCEHTLGIIKALGAILEGITIYQQIEDEYIAYLKIRKSNKSYYICINIIDGLCCTIFEDADIFVDKKVFKTSGIKINEEIIANALLN